MMQLAKQKKHHLQLCRVSIRALLTAGLFIFILSACTDKKQESVYADVTEKLIIDCGANCNQVANNVTALNGRVTYTYKNISALAVTLPITNVNELKKLAGVNNLSKDTVIPRPRVPKTFIKNRDNTTYTSQGNIEASTLTFAPLELKTLVATNPVTPNNYIYNNISNGVANLHLQDITGKGVVVAIIDSGTANNPDIVPALAGSVIGGENLVDLLNEPSATSTSNDDHGTMVGSMIAAHLAMIMPNTSPFIQSVSIHAPQSVFPVDADNSLVPMLGTAPDANLYPLKVFSATGDGGSDTSVIIAAMDRALTLKKNYDLGMNTDAVAGDGSEDNPFVYNALNIQVVNMSLGGLTLFPGNDVEDLLALEMLKNGITVVTSAGNEGFGAMTGGSPGTSTGTINVGAANSPVHERILRDMQDQVGAGIEFRPNDIMQTAFFSSRGPTADGRVGVDLVANGFASFTQAADGGIAFVSGTSFSSPTVAGAAALLWSATNEQEQEISAAHIRAALIESANPDMLDNEGDLPIDRGNGYLDAAAALALINQQLASKLDDIKVPKPPKFDGEPTKVLDNIQDVEVNIVKLSKDKRFSIDIELNPGEAINFLVPTDLKVAQLTVKMRDIDAELPIELQNVLFGDAFFFQVLDAPTSTNHVRIDERLLDADPDWTFTIPLPQSGIVRVAALGDWTNAGKISATLEISADYREKPATVFKGSIRDEQTDSFRLDIAPTTSQLNFELSWTADWGYYPPHDIDLILVDPDGNMIFDAATLHIPERLQIKNPAPGRWDVIVAGYMLHGLNDEYKLSITDQDGKRVGN